MDPLKPWQAEAILVRQRDPVDGLALLVVLGAIGLALSPFITGVAMWAGWLPR